LKEMLFRVLENAFLTSEVYFQSLGNAFLTRELISLLFYLLSNSLLTNAGKC
jgi:hypothetical protein